MLGDVLKNSKTRMVVIELVSHQLNQYKNNGVNSKLMKFCWNKFYYIGLDDF